MCGTSVSFAISRQSCYSVWWKFSLYNWPTEFAHRMFLFVVLGNVAPWAKQYVFLFVYAISYRYTFFSWHSSSVFRSEHKLSDFLWPSVTWIGWKQVLLSFSRFSSELFAISFKILLVNFPQQLTAENNTVSSLSDNLASLATQLTCLTLFLLLLWLPLLDGVKNCFANVDAIFDTTKLLGISLSRVQLACCWWPIEDDVKPLFD